MGPRLDVFVVSHSRSTRHFEGGNSSPVDTQLEVAHTLAHFTILCTSWSFPNTPVLVAKTVPSGVRIVTDACHALWEPVVILNVTIRQELSRTAQLYLTSSYWVQRPIVV